MKIITVLQVIGVQPQLYAIQQAVNDGIVSANGNALVQVIEIIVVKGKPHRQPLDNKCR